MNATIARAVDELRRQASERVSLYVGDLWPGEVEITIDGDVDLGRLIAAIQGTEPPLEG